MSFEFESDKGKAAGKAYIEGLGVGLDEGSYQAITSMENVYTVLETLTKNAAKNAEKLEKKNRERRLDNLKTALKLEIICEQEYYEKLKEFRDKNLKYGTDSWYKCTEEIAAYNKRLMEEAEKQQQFILEKQEKLTDKLIGNEKWLENSTVRFKGMGQGGSDLVYRSSKLDNFSDEVGLLETYITRLKELQALGNVPMGVLEDIAGMSLEDGLAAVNAILGADSNERLAFFSGYTARQEKSSAAAELLAEILYGNGTYSVDAVKPDAGEGLQGSLDEQLEKTFETVPEKYKDLGAEASLAFGDGFLSRLPDLMEEARSILSGAISGIINGISSGQSTTGGTTNTFNNSYTFSAAKSTITQQLAAVKNAATLEKLRGGM